MKKRWGIESNFQLLVINVVFALAGFSVVFLRPFIFDILGITRDMPFALRALLYLLLITPVYFLMLNLFGLLFGQSRFFIGFTRKTFGLSQTRQDPVGD